MKYLLIALLITGLVFVSSVEAVTETAVHDACGFSFPLSVSLNTGEGVTALDVNEVWAWEGLVRPNAGGWYVGEVTIYDGAGMISHIDLYSTEGARNWSLACDNGVNMRIASAYLDCKLAGVC